MSRILIVEDDQEIAMLERDYLEIEGFETVLVADGEEAVAAALGERYDLILLDLMLPGCNGYEICRRIRDKVDVPILMVTARTESVDKIRGLGLGADDYIAKPFDLEVLAAKVQAILRRAYAYARPADLVDCGGGVMLDLGAGALKSEAGTVELTKNELRILQTLLAQRGRTVPRDALMTALWATDCFVDENTLTVNVARLRKKLETAGLPGLIRTKKGEGYCIE